MPVVPSDTICNVFSENSEFTVSALGMLYFYFCGHTVYSLMT